MNGVALQPEPVLGPEIARATAAILLSHLALLHVFQLGAFPLIFNFIIFNYINAIQRGVFKLCGHSFYDKIQLIIAHLTK